MSHALVVGGTGMLKKVALRQLGKYDRVSVIARNKKGLEKLEKESGENSGKLNMLQLDYTDYEILKSLLIRSINDYGEISLAVSWIHSTAQRAPSIIADLINQTSAKCDFFEVLGSSFANPNNESKEREKEFGKFSNIIYHKIILGFIMENGKSRWLTNTEISGGVINAIENNSKSGIVGVVEPWSERP
ncbi:MAG: short-chain dehydrogenase [Chlorobi bacterium]|nr:short-chain dehydrogenase [Chlorobiota bacterium]MCI0715263.1 short-chain dehydrogenase [Chlorobiota bacterium]